MIREFKSPERVAAIIRSDLKGTLEEGGEFTEAGYQDERFKDPNFQVVKRQELPEVHESAGKDGDGANAAGGRERRSRQDNDWVKRFLKVGVLLVLLAVAAPFLLGIGGGLAGLILGFLGLAVGVIVCIGALTVAACIGAVALLVLGVGMLFMHPAGGILVLGFGVLVLGLAFIGVAISVLVYGRFIPCCIRSVVNFISGLLHGGRRKQA